MGSFGSPDPYQGLAVATYRDVINNVLTALTEDLIPTSQTSLSSKYHKLLGLYVNHMKEAVEDAHQWRVLRRTDEVTVSAGTNSAAIPLANERSRVYRIYNEQCGEHQALVFDVTDSNNPYRLREMDLPELLHRRALDTSNGTQPIFFAADNTGASAAYLQVWPTPSADRTIRITTITPQLPLGVDDLDTAILVPTRPIEIGAIWYALEERGEELGVNGLFTQDLFDRVLGEAVMRDAAEQGGYQLVPQ